MSLYKAMTEDYYAIHIEADNFSRALVVWHTWARAEWGEDYDEKDQPASIALVDDGMVWRDGDTDEKELEFLRKHNSILAMALSDATVNLANYSEMHRGLSSIGIANQMMVKAEKAYVDCDCLKEQEKP